MSRIKEWLLTDTPESDFHARCGRLYQNWLMIRNNPLTMAGLSIVVLLLLMAVFAPLLSTHSPDFQNLDARLMPPSWEHLFGTDHMGRDIYSRIIYGSRLSLYIIIMVAAISAPLGMLIGMVAGFSRGWVDMVLMRITDIFMAFPKLILALSFVAVMGPGIENAIIAIAVTTWPPYARISRAETLTIRNADFIHAARLQGGSPGKILLGHITPLCMTSVVVRMTLDMAGVIITAAGLGFLGLGAQPPLAEWGAMIAVGREYMIDFWWVAAVPGIAIFTVSLGFNLLGDGLRDVFDPRHQS